MEQKAKTRPSPDRRPSAPLGGKHGVMVVPKTAMTAANAVQRRQAPPATLVIFGAGGDLTKRLVVPALYHLVQAGRLPDAFAVIGVDRSDTHHSDGIGRFNAAIHRNGNFQRQQHANPPVSDMEFP